MSKHIFQYFNEIFPACWDNPALSDYRGDKNLTYHQLAEEIEKMHFRLRELGVAEGDKVAMAGRNSTNWAVTYLGIVTYGAVVVSILQDFSGEDIAKLVNHSDAKILFVGPYILKTMDLTQMPNLSAVVSLDDFSIISGQAIADIETLFAAKYPNGLQKEDVHYPTDKWDDLMIINYTSGTSGNPKGVMLSYRNLSNNVANAVVSLPNHAGQEIVSMLPLAHMYGQLGEFLYQLATGCHIYFLTKSPTPTLLLKAFQDVHPYMIIAVPLVIEKIYKKSIAPIRNKWIVKILWHTPGIRHIFRKKVKQGLLNAFGGQIEFLLLGGSALNPDVEKCLMDIHFPLTIGYGMTECGPLISGDEPKYFVRRSAGQILPGMEAKIINPNEKGIGEIVVRGENVMLGYYKNEEATRQTFTEDGWLRTGDLGILDKHNYIYIKGRNKNMILGASGQNIYPEEIEDKLNNQAGVVESLIVERNGHLIGLVFPDYDFSAEEEKSLTDIMKENLEKLNKMLPKYMQVSKIELQDKEFEKTPKKSIKRFLYK